VRRFARHTRQQSARIRRDDALGHIVRSSMTIGLVISATRPANQSSDTYDITITGERVAEFARLPAVFLTPVSSSARSCLCAQSQSMDC
jgi:hypothetical protein